MREQLKLKFAEASDVPQVVEWLNRTRNNEFDPAILRYPTLRVLCAYNGVPVGYLPTQQALVLESLGLNPALSAQEHGQAIRDLVKGSELLASSLGIKEILFLGTDDAVNSIAGHHGFEEVKYKVYRMRL